jgi:hypothetical protein
MPDEKEMNQFIAQHPELFGTPPYIGLECSEGWYGVILDTFKKISAIVLREERTDFRIVQVKEKFGGLRIYCNYFTHKIDEVITEAEEKAKKTCEICGSPGTLRKEGWRRTLCDVHASMKR